MSDDDRISFKVESDEASGYDAVKGALATAISRDKEAVYERIISCCLMSATERLTRTWISLSDFCDLYPKEFIYEAMERIAREGFSVERWHLGKWQFNTWTISW